MKRKDKNVAVRLRKQGCSLNHIAKTVGISKSTASLWCRDVPIPAAAKRQLQNRTKESSVAGLARYAADQRRMKEARIIAAEAKGAQQLGLLSRRDIYCIGLGLYRGEGYKQGSQEFGFTNSDPDMILFYLTWLDVVFSVSKQRLIFRISINDMHANRLSAVEQYWQTLLAVPKSQFTKPSLIKTKNRKKYRNHDTHMGTLRVKVRKGTELRREVIGSIKSI